jgi:hypothetical protein
MGMFDTIYLDKAIACKTCGGDVLDFQTKEFDSCMNHYRVGSVLLGSRVLSGVIKDEAYCRACSDAKRHAWTDVYLVVWHTILAGVETEESKAQARLASVDRLDLVQWIAEAQKNEQQWRRRFYSLHNELRRWHEYVEEQKNHRNRNPKATKDCGCFVRSGAHQRKSKQQRTRLEKFWNYTPPRKTKKSLGFSDFRFFREARSNLAAFRKESASSNSAMLVGVLGALKNF